MPSNDGKFLCYECASCSHSWRSDELWPTCPLCGTPTDPTDYDEDPDELNFDDCGEIR